MTSDEHPGPCSDGDIIRLLNTRQSQLCSEIAGPES